MTSGTRGRVLLVRAWTYEVEPIVERLREARLDPEIVRVDFEAALHAALTQDRFDLVVHDEAAISRDVIEGALRERADVPPLVAVEPLATLTTRVADALRARRN
jgi:hypothetical protein